MGNLIDEMEARETYSRTSREGPGLFSAWRWKEEILETGKDKENNGEEESEVGRTGKGWKRFPEGRKGYEPSLSGPGEIVGGYSS